MPVKEHEGGPIPTAVEAKVNTGRLVNDDVTVVDAVDSDEEMDGSDDDADFHESEGEVVASDDEDDEVDDGDSEDEGVRPRRVADIDIDEGGDEDLGEGDEGDHAGPSGGYEWREVPVDGYTRRKRVGIPCEVFQVAKKKRRR